jgi:hypothetical protein
MRFLQSLLKKHWRLIGLAIMIMAVARLVVPCSVQGDWVGSYTAHLCEDHAFLRFADGHSVYYHGDLDPQFQGIYDKVGWNTYSLRYSRTDKSPYILHVGWLFIHMTREGESRWLYRDFRVIEDRQMLRNAQANARHARERIDFLKQGMTAPEVWNTLELADFRTPKRSAYRTQDVFTANYLLSPGEILHCDWNMRSNPPTLLKVDFTGWPDGL